MTHLLISRIQKEANSDTSQTCKLEPTEEYKGTTVDHLIGQGTAQQTFAPDCQNIVIIWLMAAVSDNTKSHT